MQIGRTRPPSRRVPSYLRAAYFCRDPDLPRRRSARLRRAVRGVLAHRLTPGVDSRRSDDSAPFKVFTVARSPEPVVATGGLRVEPHFAFDTCPPIDVLAACRAASAPAPARGPRACCRGFAPLAAVGVAHHLGVHGGAAPGPGRAAARPRATTHWGALDLLASSTPPSPSIGGPGRRRPGDHFRRVSAGMDMAFHVVDKVCWRRGGHRNRALHRVTVVRGCPVTRP